MDVAPFQALDDRNSRIDPGGDETLVLQAREAGAEDRLLQAEADQRGADDLAERLGAGELEPPLGGVPLEDSDREVEPAPDVAS
jgi:hypothetical protein